MRRRDHEMRIEPRAALAQDAVVVDHDELGSGAHTPRRLRSEAHECITRVLFPITIGFEQDRRGLRVRGEPGDDVLEEPRPLLAREGAEVVAPKARRGGMAAEQEWRRELDPTPRVVRLRRGPRAEEHPGREVLDLALAVDSGIR